MIHRPKRTSDLPRGRRQTVRRPLNALIAALAIAVSILAWALAKRQIGFERAKAIQAAVAQNDDRTVILQQFVSRTLGMADIAALHVAALHALGALPTGKTGEPSRIDGRVAYDPGFLGLSLIDADGDLVAATLDANAAMPNVRTHPAFAVHRAGDTGRLFVSTPGRSRLLSRQTVWLTKRLSHPDGRFAGIVAIDVAPAQLTAIFGANGVKPSEVAWVVGLDGIIRSRRTGDTVSSGENVSHGLVFRMQRRVDYGHFRGPGTLDGKMRLVSHRRVPGYPLFVSYSIEEGEVLKEVRGRARLFLFGAGLVTLASLVIAALVISAIRQRERRALELAASNARLEEAQRVARIGDWAHHFADDRIIWSPQLYELYERDPALGPLRGELHAMLSEDSVQRMRASVAHLVENGSPVSWEMKVRLPSGRTAHHLALAVPTRDEQGAIVGFHGTTQDVTEQKKLEALQDDLAHLSRVGAMNALTATLSHELNQPLTAASNYLSAAQRLASRITEPSLSQLAGIIREGQAQVVRAGDIIQRMRNLVTKGSSSRAIISIADLIEEALAIISVTKACPYPIPVDGADPNILVRVDSVQIQQVILNLVRNACEAQKDRDVPPPRIAVSPDADARVVVTVLDNGPGMPEEVLKRLFEPFMSSKQSGLGLGLSISRTIVEAHGGTMQARNRPSGGAAVSFTLPLHNREGPQCFEEGPC